LFGPIVIGYLIIGKTDSWWESKSPAVRVRIP
jgi:hypothetical protein